MTRLTGSPEEQAARWFASRRRGVMTLEERAAFDAWRREPTNKAAMTEMERAWGLLQTVEDRFAPDTGEVQPSRGARIARSALLAAVCAVFLGIGVISYSGNHEFWTNLDWIDR